MRVADASVTVEYLAFSEVVQGHGAVVLLLDGGRNPWRCGVHTSVPLCLKIPLVFGGLSLLVLGREPLQRDCS